MAQPRGAGPSQPSPGGGQLPEALQSASYNMAILLRYEAPKRGLCNTEGWVDLQTVLAELRKKSLNVSEGDVLKIVQTSFSKEKPRFEKWQSGSQTSVRAVDGESYRARPARGARGRGRGGVRSSRSDAGERSSQCGPHRFDSAANRAAADVGWPRPAAGSAVGGESTAASSQAAPSMSSTDLGLSSRSPPGVSSANHVTQRCASGSSQFDGLWETEKAQCRIAGDEVRWMVPGLDYAARKTGVKGRDIWVGGDNKNWVKGTLSQDGKRIDFEDGDKWTKVTEDNTFHDDYGKSSAARTQPVTPNSPKAYHEAGWTDMRVKEDWDAAELGDQYLSLSKGELLIVSPEQQDGWAYACSYQGQREGWFPPSYVYACPDPQAA